MEYFSYSKKIKIFVGTRVLIALETDKTTLKKRKIYYMRNIPYHNKLRSFPHKRDYLDRGKCHIGASKDERGPKKFR